MPNRGIHATLADWSRKKRRDYCLGRSDIQILPFFGQILLIRPKRRVTGLFVYQYRSERKSEHHYPNVTCRQ